MLTLCFTSVAIREIRRTHSVVKTTRNPNTVVRATRLGLFAVIVALAGSVANAGGPGHAISLGGNSSRSSNSSNSSSNSSQLSNKFVLGNQTSSNSKSDSKLNLNTSNLTDKKVTLPIDSSKLGTNKPALDLKKVNLTDTAKNQLNKLPVTNKLTDNLKNGKLGDLKVNGIGNKLDGLKLNDKLSKMSKKDFKDFCSDKCFHDCFHCCPWWYCWTYPTWCPLYRYGCGYWYDAPVVEIAEGVDLQLLSVRMIDAGDENQGPAFRVWVRNNSHVDIAHPFNVLVLAARGPQPTADLPQSGVRISAIGAGQILPVDIRLPAAANQPGLPMLHVVVDSHREINEVFEDNNGAVLNRGDILPLEAVAAGGPEQAAPGPMQGPMAGQVSAN